MEKTTKPRIFRPGIKVKYHHTICTTFGDQRSERLLTFPGNYATIAPSAPFPLALHFELLDDIGTR